MTAAIVVDSLVKSYDGRRVVDGVSFAVGQGEVLALVGPNGAGKTTTVEIIEGYRRSDGGSVTVLGVEPTRAGREDRARVGLMLQGGGGVDPRLTPREVLRLHAGLYAAPRDAQELIELVGLGRAAGTRFRRLSGGERQRLGVALALVGRPDVVILDEPTAGLDVEGRALMRDVVGGLRAVGVAVLMTSHDLVDVERVADRIVIVDRGRVVAAGSVHEMTAGAAAGLVVRLDPPPTEGTLLALAEAVDGEVALEPNGTVRIDGVGATPEAVRAVADWCAGRGILIVELRAGRSTLEERYVGLTGRGREPEDQG